MWCNEPRLSVPACSIDTVLLHPRCTFYYTLRVFFLLFRISCLKQLTREDVCLTPVEDRTALNRIKGHIDLEFEDLEAAWTS